MKLAYQTGWPEIAFTELSHFLNRMGTAPPTTAHFSLKGRLFNSSSRIDQWNITGRNGAAMTAADWGKISSRYTSLYPVSRYTGRWETPPALFRATPERTPGRPGTKGISCVVFPVK
jgi:hypothetical protein